MRVIVDAEKLFDFSFRACFDESRVRDDHWGSCLPTRVDHRVRLPGSFGEVVLHPEIQ